MIISYFDVVDIAFVPLETDSPLIVDAYAVLSLPVSAERLQAVGRGDPQFSQVNDRVQHPQLPHCNPLNIMRELLRKLSFEYLFSFFTSKRLDHVYIVTQCVIIVKEYCRPAHPRGSLSPAGYWLPLNMGTVPPHVYAFRKAFHSVDTTASLC